MTKMNISMEQKQTQRTDLWVPKGKGGMDGEFGIS